MGDGPEITSPSDKETKLDNLKPLIRVIDDDYAMRRSWAFLIEGEGWEVVTYSNALAFLAANDFSRPGCLLLDVRMPRMSGLELQNALKDKGVDLPIIFISGHGDIDMAVRGLKSGAEDFLQKPVDDRKLLDAISNAVLKNLNARRADAEISSFKTKIESLTQREREVIRMVAQGASNKDSAFPKRPFRFTAVRPTGSLRFITPLKSRGFLCAAAILCNS